MQRPNYKIISVIIIVADLYAPIDFILVRWNPYGLIHYIKISLDDILQ